MHQVHLAYNVRDLTDADEQILEKAFNKTRQLMPRITAKKIKFDDKQWDSLFNLLMAEQIAFARVLSEGDENLTTYAQAKNQAEQAAALVNAQMVKLDKK